MKYIIRNLRYYLFGIPAWTIHELAHFVAFFIIRITYFIHLDRAHSLKINCFKLTTKECHLSMSYTCEAHWIGIIISLAPRMMYVIFPIILMLIGNIYLSIYGMIIMTKKSFDMSYRDKHTMLTNIQAITQKKQQTAL